MKISAEQISLNWDTFISYIDKYISSPRKEKLIQFYEKYKDRIILMPASHRPEYHSPIPGGYIHHVLQVVKASLATHKLWEDMGADISTYSIEELIFSALNHDLGKIGDENYESYIPQTDEWRKNKLGEIYKFNEKLPFASVPDRGLYLLQAHDIKYSFNEMLAIKTHDGLYDESNKKYLYNFQPELKPRTNLVYILHQADMIAARIEFEQEWMPKFKEKKEPTKSNKNKALGTIKSKGLQEMINNI